MVLIPKFYIPCPSLNPGISMPYLIIIGRVTTYKPTINKNTKNRIQSDIKILYKIKLQMPRVSHEMAHSTYAKLLNVVLFSGILS